MALNENLADRCLWHRQIEKAAADAGTCLPFFTAATICHRIP